MADHIDTTEIGILAAKLMDDIAGDLSDDVLPKDAVVRSALLVVEVGSESEGSSLVTVRVTDDRNVIGLGLVERARAALLWPEGDLADG